MFDAWSRRKKNEALLWVYDTALKDERMFDLIQKAEVLPYGILKKRIKTLRKRLSRQG